MPGSTLYEYGFELRFQAEKATDILTLSGNFSNGDTIRVGSRIYTAQTVLTNVAGNFLIGVSASVSIDNLIKAIIRAGGGDGHGTLYAELTLANPLVTAAAGAGDTMLVTSLTAGPMADPTVSETGSVGVWTKGLMTQEYSVLAAPGAGQQIISGWVTAAFPFLDATAATTNHKFASIGNTGGNIYFGVEGSVGGTLAVGLPAYSSMVGSNPAGGNLYLVVQNEVYMGITTTGNIYMGRLDNDSGVATTVRIGANSLPGAGSANVSGGDGRITSGAGKGTAVPSRLFWATPASTGVSGTGPQTMTDRVEVGVSGMIADVPILGRSPSGGVGYTVGAGGAVVQGTSKATGVSLDKMCGNITMHGAALGPDAIVSFILANAGLGVGDQLLISHVATGTFGAYHFNSRCAGGFAFIDVTNISAGSLSEAIVLLFTVIKGAVT